MRNEEILKKIGNIIDDVKDQYQYLTVTKDYNVLELELFSANAEFLLNHIEVLKKLQLSAVKNIATKDDSSISLVSHIINTPAPSLHSLETPETLLSNTLKDIDLTEEPSEVKFDFEQNLPIQNIYDRELTPKETEVLENKHISFSKLNEVNQTQTTTNNLQPNQNIETPLVPMQNQVVNDTPATQLHEQDTINVSQPQHSSQSQPQTLNQFLSNQTSAQNISSRLSNLATNDLKSAISLNDKMIFIKDLFQGYNLAYSEAIEILNRFDSFESADNFLQKNYAIKNKWVDKQSIVDRFYEILNKRYVK